LEKIKKSVIYSGDKWPPPDNCGSTVGMIYDTDAIISIDYWPEFSNRPTTRKGKALNRPNGISYIRIYCGRIWLFS